MKRLVALSTALLLAGCGQADSGRVAFDQVEVQAFLEREVARTLPGLSVGAASCPAELPSDPGATATCTIVVERVPLQYDVQRLVGDRFEARPQRPVVTVRELASAVQSKLEAPAAIVQCGTAPVLQPSVGQPIPCQITGAGPPRTAMVHVSADGAVTVTDT